MSQNGSVSLQLCFGAQKAHSRRLDKVHQEECSLFMEFSTIRISNKNTELEILDQVWKPSISCLKADISVLDFTH